jgi:prevent-host-death family protein
MVKNSRTIPAGQFKAKCLALLDEVAETGQPVVVTKHGRPVAQLLPIRDEKDNANPLNGSILFQKDMVAPILGSWEMDG